MTNGLVRQLDYRQRDVCKRFESALGAGPRRFALGITRIEPDLHLRLEDVWVTYDPGSRFCIVFVAVQRACAGRLKFLSSMGRLSVGLKQEQSQAR
jgi:hypothetical protein